MIEYEDYANNNVRIVEAYNPKTDTFSYEIGVGISALPMNQTDFIHLCELAKAFYDDRIDS